MLPVPGLNRCRRALSVVVRWIPARPTRTRRRQCLAPLSEPLGVPPEALRRSQVRLSSAPSAPGIVRHELRGREAHILGDIAELGGELKVKGVCHGAEV